MSDPGTPVVDPFDLPHADADIPVDSVDSRFRWAQPLSYLWSSLLDFLRGRVTVARNGQDGFREADMGNESNFVYDGALKIWRRANEGEEDARKRGEEATRKHMLSCSNTSNTGQLAPPPPKDTRTEEQKARAREQMYQ